MTLPETYRPWIMGAGIPLVYLLLVFGSPIRANLRDGLRCLRRHNTLWVMLMIFGLCYAIFQIAQEVFLYDNMPEGMRPDFFWHRPWFLPEGTRVSILKTSVLPALENVAGLFNVLITTFPFSAIAALLFFINWDNHHAVLLRALRRRFDGPGLLVYAGILLCALAALAKPFLFTALFLQAGSETSGLRLLQCSFVIDWLSFLFEIMFGAGVQIYLILMVYAWVRGLNFTHRHLIDFAIRRFSFVIKWSLVVMLAGTLLINIPLILSNVPPFSHYVSADLLPGGYIDGIARPALAVFLILFCSMQIVLTFHGESLGMALRDHFQFLAREWMQVGFFLVVAFTHFYILNVINGIMKTGFGSDTAAAIAWSLFYPLPAGFVGAWMLAAWVCLYKRSETGRARAENWIQY